MSTDLLRMLGSGAAMLLCAGLAHAEPVTLEFAFASPASSAEAVGEITLDAAALANPGVNILAGDDPAIMDLRLEVLGAAAGNGSHDASDFCWIYLDTGAAGLDPDAELVGQPTGADPWGSAGSVGGAVPHGGDFNLGACDPATAPTGSWWFTLRPADGNTAADDADDMQLVSMRVAGAVAPPGGGPGAGPTGVPALGAAGLVLLLGLLGLAGAWAALRQEPGR